MPENLRAQYSKVMALMLADGRYFEQQMWYSKCVSSVILCAEIMWLIASSKPYLCYTLQGGVATGLKHAEIINDNLVAGFLYGALVKEFGKVLSVFCNEFTIRIWCRSYFGLDILLSRHFAPRTFCLLRELFARWKTANEMKTDGEDDERQMRWGRQRCRRYPFILAVCNFVVGEMSRHVTKRLWDEKSWGQNVLGWNVLMTSLHSTSAVD